MCPAFKELGAPQIKSKQDTEEETKTSKPLSGSA